MRDKIFLDTNIIIYFYSNDKLKSKIAKNLLETPGINYVISHPGHLRVYLCDGQKICLSA